MFTCINCAVLPILSICMKYAKAENFKIPYKMFLKTVTGTAYDGIDIKQMAETW